MSEQALVGPGLELAEWRWQRLTGSGAGQPPKPKPGTQQQAGDAATRERRTREKSRTAQRARFRGLPAARPTCHLSCPPAQRSHLHQIAHLHHLLDSFGHLLRWEEGSA